MNAIDLFFQKQIQSSKVLSTINQYKIEFGILAEDGSKTIDVNIINLDDSTSKKTLRIADVMFFVENGTLMIPGKPVLEKISKYANDELTKVLNNLVDLAMGSGILDNQIENELRILCVKIEIYAKSICQEIMRESNLLSNLLEQEEGQKYLINLNKLAQYIKCRLIRIG